MNLKNQKAMVVLAILLTFAFCMLTVPNAAASSVRSVSQRYIVGEVGEVTLSCLLTKASIGGACFQRNDILERQISVSIVDDQGWLVAGQVDFYDAVGSPYGYKLFCGSTTASIPEGAGYILVYTEGLGGFLDGTCPESRPATSGTIYADFITP